MKSAIAIRHVAFEDLGDFAPILREHGYAIQILDAGVDALDTQASRHADLLIVLGAPIGAFDEALYPFLLDELSLLQHRLANQQPTLGICLGAQLMARALGAEVAPMGHKEIGYAPLSFIEPDSVLAPLGDIPVLHWHGDQFAIPQAASPRARFAPIRRSRLGTTRSACNAILKPMPARLNAGSSAMPLSCSKPVSTRTPFANTPKCMATRCALPRVPC